MSISSDLNEYFKIEEKHLTGPAIRRLKIAVIAAMPIIPVAAGFDLTSSESHTAWSFVATPVALVALLAFLFVILNPLSNTLMRNDKELDEWGISHKLKAQSFAFRITSSLLFILWALNVATSFIPQIPKLQVSLSMYDVGNLMLAIMFFLWLISSAHIAWTIRPISTEDGLPIREDKAVVTARRQRVEATIIFVVVILTLLAICASFIAWGWMDAHQAAGH